VREIEAGMDAPEPRRRDHGRRPNRKESQLEKTRLNTSQLGATGLEITTVGFGAWAIGGGGWEFGWGP
jgi:hypothetical protein